MEQNQIHTSTAKLKKSRKSFFSWIINNTSLNNTTDETETNKHNLEVKDQHQLQLMNTSFSCPTTTTNSFNNLQVATNHNIVINHHSDVEIPSRRQSHLYTPFHKEQQQHQQQQSDIILSDSNEGYPKKSCYSAQLASPTDLNISTSSSSLTRSATWQASCASSITINNTLENPNQSLHADCIPDRRTSRNYASNPEIQARLNEMLNSDRTTYLSSVLRSSNNTTVHRRSTTP